MMTEPVLMVAATVLLASSVTFALQTRQAARRRDRARQSYFDKCAADLDHCRIEHTVTGFARLSAQYRGNLVDLRAVPDMLTFRKLPALWVLVTVPGPVPVRATLDLMLRPSGMEPFSAFDRLQHDLAVPADFPADCVLRTDDPASACSIEILRPHLALFDDPRVKELVICPRGLRVVFLAEEADRARYLIFRDGEMGRTPLPPDRLAPVLDRLLAIKADLARTSLEVPEGQAA
jgi:hypothetical protein